MKNKIEILRCVHIKKEINKQSKEISKRIGIKILILNHLLKKKEKQEGRNDRLFITGYEI